MLYGQHRAAAFEREVISLKSIVIYASRYGNTRKVAEAIAEALHASGEVQLLPADEAPAIPLEQVDLIVIGGPTEVHRMTPLVAQLFANMARGSLRNVAAAAFDTRLDAARWLTGSAALGISRKLQRLGARMITPAESFFVAGKADPATGAMPELASGELERAGVWATSLADMVETQASTAVHETI
jgi:flavodoxin